MSEDKLEPIECNGNTPAGGDSGITRIVPSKRPKGTKLEDILALKREGFSDTEVGRRLNVSRQAVTAMMKRSGIDLTGVEEYRQTKNLQFHMKQKAMLDGITPEKIKKSSAAQLAVGVGIFADKLKDLENPISGILNSSVRWIDVVQSANVKMKDSWQQERKGLADKGLDPDYQDKEYQARARVRAAEAGPEVLAEHDAYMKDQGEKYRAAGK
jgi:hypothetical protein